MQARLERKRPQHVQRRERVQRGGRDREIRPDRRRRLVLEERFPRGPVETRGLETMPVAFLGVEANPAAEAASRRRAACPACSTASRAWPGAARASPRRRCSRPSNRATASCPVTVMTTVPAARNVDHETSYVSVSPAWNGTVASDGPQKLRMRRGRSGRARARRPSRQLTRQPSVRRLFINSTDRSMRSLG